MHGFVSHEHLLKMQGTMPQTTMDKENGMYDYAKRTKNNNKNRH